MLCHSVLWHFPASDLCQWIIQIFDRLDKQEEVIFISCHWFSWKYHSASSVNAALLSYLKLKYCFCYDEWITMSYLRKLRGTIVNIISPPRVLFYRREFIFIAASFILLPRDLFYCREIYLTATSLVLPPRVLLSPPRILFYRRVIYFNTASFIFTAAVK